jgi:hypothetical protein
VPPPLVSESAPAPGISKRPEIAAEWFAELSYVMGSYRDWPLEAREELFCRVVAKIQEALEIPED